MNTVCENILEKVLNLEKSLNCPECDEVFKDPVIIGRCGHTFCRVCVKDYIGKQCPTCKLPIDNKDTHDDKQLKNLLPLVQELKAILQTGGLELQLESQSSSNPASPFVNNGETPISARLKTTEKLGRSVNKARRIKKPNHCHDSNCNNSPTACLPVTPKVSSYQKKVASSPLSKKLKRSPFRYSAFSSGKRGLNGLRSPQKKNSPISGNLEKKNIKGETLLHVAVIKGDVEKVATLLEKKAQPNVTDNAGWTPLHEASQKGFLEIIELLVKHGAIVNVPGPDNITPLHDAILNGQIEVAKFLVSAKADLYARTSENYNALDLCRNEEWKSTLLKISSGEKVVEVSKKAKSPSAKVKMIILYTSLEESQIENLQRCANEVLNAGVVDNFNSSAVTHIVTSLDNNKKCKRTVKILQGILSGKWIVSYQWVEACLKQKKHVDEDAYEAKGTIQQPIQGGPSRARKNDEKYPLFHGCYFFLYGCFNSPVPSKDIIGQLIQLGGGKLLAREPKLEVLETTKFLTPHHTENGPLSDFNHFILYHEKPPRQAQAKPIAVVNFQWFVNSICAFTLLDPNSN